MVECNGFNMTVFGLLCGIGFSGHALSPCSGGMFELERRYF